MAQSRPLVDHNVVSHLASAAEAYPDRLALIQALPGGGSEQITFGELWEQVQRTSTGLTSIGIAPSDRVIVMIPMSIQLYAAMLALVKLGATATFLDPWVPPGQIAQLGQFADAKGFLGVPKVHLLRLWYGGLRRIPVSITTGRRLWFIPARHSLAKLSRAAAGPAVAAVRREDDALITFTTGSSGIPKGARRTHGFLLAQHLALASVFPQQPGSKDMTHFPVFALNNLASGVTTLIPNLSFSRVAEANGAALIRDMVDVGVTTGTMSPSLLDRLVDAKLVGERDPGLRRVLVGGAPISDRQIERWIANLPSTEITLVYGSTEAEPVAHIDAKERLELHRDSGMPGICCGVPIAAVRTRLLPIDGRPLETSLSQGEVGELAVGGEHIGRHYFRNPEAERENKLLESDGSFWHRMGDTGTMDPKGRFWLTGRVHTTIRRDGELLHATAIEQTAHRHAPEAEQIAALGMPHQKLGQALVVILHGRQVSQQTVATVKAKLEGAGVTVDRVVVSQKALPVDPRHNAKIDYPRLAKRLASLGIVPEDL